MRLAALGTIIGLATAAAATQGLASLLFSIWRLDLTTTYSGVVTLPAGVSVIAVDPSITLRTE
jgi:hypothetical protein